MKSSAGERVPEKTVSVIVFRSIAIEMALRTSTFSKSLLYFSGVPM